MNSNLAPRLTVRTATCLILAPLITTASLAAQHGIWTRLGPDAQRAGQIHYRQDAAGLTVFAPFTGVRRDSTLGQIPLIRGRDWLAAVTGANSARVFPARGGAPVDVTLPLSAAKGGSGTDQFFMYTGNRLAAVSGRTGALDVAWLPNAMVSSGRSVAVGAFGTRATAFSPFTGKWSPTTLAANASRVRATESLGIVEDGFKVYAYSARLDRWAESDFWGRVSVDGDVMVVRDATRCGVVSGSVGRYDRLPVTGAVLSARAFGTLAFAIVDGDEWCYGGIAGRWLKVPREAAPYRTATTGAALVFERVDRVRVFSPITGTSAATVFGAIATRVGFGDTATTATVGTDHRIYSHWTGTWHQAPAATDLPLVTRTAVYCRDGAGWTAFSPRQARFYPAPATGPTSRAIGNRSLGGVLDDRYLHVFDEASARWVAHEFSGSPPAANLQFGDETILVRVGNEAVAYSSRLAEFVTLTTTGTVTGSGVVDGSAWVQDQAGYHVFGAIPDLVTAAAYPESDELPGGPVRLTAKTPPGSSVLGVVGRAHAPIATPVGALLLDPGSLVTFGMPTADAAGLSRLTLPLPTGNWTRGLELGFQAVAFRQGGGSPYLTGRATQRLY